MAGEWVQDPCRERADLENKAIACQLAVARQNGRRPPLGTDLGSDPQQPAGGPVLHAAAPNPFAEATSLAFTLPRAGHVTLRLFDVAGREVATLVDRDRTSGLHRVRIDAAPLAAGAYFARLETADGVRSRRIVRLR